MQSGDDGGLFGPDLQAWEELFIQALEIGRNGTCVNGRHRGALIATSGARYVAVADLR